MYKIETLAILQLIVSMIASAALLDDFDGGPPISP
jgi:hypothetical protein